MSNKNSLLSGEKAQRAREVFINVLTHFLSITSFALPAFPVPGPSASSATGKPSPVLNPAACRMTFLPTASGLLGIKTGNTESGASFLGAACRNNVMLYSCVLCRDDSWGRFEDTASLLDWAYGLYEQKALARSNWILRVAPWQDGFWLRCPVSAQRDVTGYVFPDQRVSYTTVQYKPNSLVAANSTYGTTLWEQGERSVGSVAYQTSRPQQSAAWKSHRPPAVCCLGRHVHDGPMDSHRGCTTL